MAKFSVRGMALRNRTKTLSEALRLSRPDDDIAVYGKEKEVGLHVEHTLNIEGQNNVRMKVPEHSLGFLFKGSGTVNLAHFEILCKQIANGISIKDWNGKITFDDITTDYNTKEVDKRYPTLSASSLSDTAKITIQNSNLNNIYIKRPSEINVVNTVINDVAILKASNITVNQSRFEDVIIDTDKCLLDNLSATSTEITGTGSVNNLTIEQGGIFKGKLTINNLQSNANATLLLSDGVFTLKNTDLSHVNLKVVNAEVIIEENAKLPDKFDDENSRITNHTATDRKGEGLKELNSLIGLTPVKNTINGYVNLAKMNILRKQNGLDTTDMSLHMIFAGSPGTGKTTVAKIVGRILREQGLVKNTNFISVSQKDIIGQYEGDAPANMSKYIHQAMGGILFIDEAYSLLPDTSGSTGGHYGEQALNQLTDDMEKYHNDVVVILAGYSDSMHDFLKRANPGLASRFATWVEFPDYSVDELYKIAQYQLNRQQLITNEEVNAYIYTAIKNFHEANMIDGNGRFVRNFIQKIIMALSNRVAQSEVLNKEDLLTLTVEDVQKGYREYGQELLKKRSA